MRLIVSMAASMCFAALLAGCGAVTFPGTPPAVTAPPASAPVDATAPAASGEPSGESTTGGGAGPPVLGSVTYTADAARTRTVEVPVGASPTTLSVADTSEATWTLSIPAGAFLDPRTISMTPLSEIDASGLPGPVLGGILLEPEGTLFTEPATLTVTGGPKNGAVAVLAGDEQGNARLEVPAGDAWGTVRVEHFSPWYAVDPTDPSWHKTFNDSQADAAAAAGEAEKLLKQQDLKVPEAPSISAGCRDDAAQATADGTIKAFVDALLQPESGLIWRLLAADKVRQLFGSSDGDYSQLVRRLAERQLRKASAVLTNTPPQPDKVLSVLNGVLTLGKAAELVGVDSQAVMARVPSWVGKAVDPTLEKIAREHDYQKVMIAWWLAKWVEQLGGSANVEDLQLKLQRAMSFDASLQWSVQNPDGEHWLTSGTIPLRYEAPLSKDSPWLSGEATVSDISYGGHPDGLILLVSPFATKVRLIVVDVCAGTARFGVDRFFSDDESYRDPQGGGLTLSRSWVNWAFVQDPEYMDGYYTFPVKLHNGSARWIDETIPKAVEGWTSEFQIVIEHKPGS